MKTKDSLILEELYTKLTEETPLSKEEIMQAQTLAEYMERTINSINPTMNYRTLAKALKILMDKAEFGSHNVPAFAKAILNSKL